jgi:hypothetical protein
VKKAAAYTVEQLEAFIKENEGKVGRKKTKKEPTPKAVTGKKRGRPAKVKEEKVPEPTAQAPLDTEFDDASGKAEADAEEEIDDTEDNE